jgi:hypothetical protein
MAPLKERKAWCKLDHLLRRRAKDCDCKKNLVRVFNQLCNHCLSLVNKLTKVADRSLSINSKRSETVQATLAAAIPPVSAFSHRQGTKPLQQLYNSRLSSKIKTFKWSRNKCKLTSIRFENSEKSSSSRDLSDAKAIKEQPTVVTTWYQRALMGLKTTAFYP